MASASQTQAGSDNHKSQQQAHHRATQALFDNGDTRRIDVGECSTTAAKQVRRRADQRASEDSLQTCGGPSLAQEAVRQRPLQEIRRIYPRETVTRTRNRHYRRIMEAIIVSIGKAERGINAAHLTANVAVQIIFRWSAEYFSALDGYRNELRKRKLRLLDQGPARKSGRPAVLRAANDQ